MRAQSEFDWNTAKLGAFAGVVAAIAPFFFFWITLPAMNGWERGITISLVVVGAVIGYVVAGRRTRLSLLIVLAVIFSTSYVCWYALASIRESKVAALRPQLHNYAEMQGAPPANNARPVARSRGKVVAVDVDTKDIDPVQLLLPDELRAAKPDEVRVVLQLKWDKEHVGDYLGGGKAFRRFCDARLIQIADKPLLLEEKRFYGGDPPNRGSSGDQFGQPPYAQIVEYLTRLSN